MRACFKLLTSVGALPAVLGPCTVRSLAAYGYAMNSGGSAGIAVRPAMCERVAIANTIRRTLRAGRLFRRAPLRRRVTFVPGSDSCLDLAYRG